MPKVKVVKINTVMDINNTKNNKKEDIKNSSLKKILSSPKKIKAFLEKRSKYRNHIEHDNKFKSQFKKTNKKEPEIKKKKKVRTKKTSVMKKKKYNKKDIDVIFKELCRDTNIVELNKKKLLSIFKKIIIKNDNNLTNKFIKEINRDQLVFILDLLKLVKLETTAPTPLLKNILYNYLTTKIKIIRL